MNAMNLTSDLMQSIGWTLLHTLWQAPVIYIAMMSVNRLLGVRRSHARYGVAVAAMMLTILCASLTFGLLMSTGTTTVESVTYQKIANVSSPLVMGIQNTTLQTILQWVDAQLVWVLRFWFFGFVIYSFRLVSGLWYVNKLKRNSFSLGDEWNQLVSKLASDLNISRVISIAEAKVASPMVVGYLKPVILFPLGLVAGLSATQVETILLHELSHIRRHDYLVNVCQVMTEAIFFFNPFVWMISAEIRREREHCCDDMVIANGIDPLAYARTLADLEANAGSQLALGIVGNQNELLNRIKRIMQKSAKNEWSNGRLLPASLVVLGLVFASWLSVENSEHGSIAPDAITYVVADTAKPKKIEPKESRNKNKAEEVTPAPDRTESYYSFRRNPDADWEKFEQEFNEKFKDTFGDFYEKNQDQIARMMEELRRTQEGNETLLRMDSELWEEMERMKMMTPPSFTMPDIPEGRLEALVAPLAELGVTMPSLEGFEVLRADAMRQAEMAELLDLELMSETAAAEIANLRNHWNLSNDLLEELQAKELWGAGSDLKEWDLQMKAYEEELHKMLIEDGYITKDAPWNGLTIDVSESAITINGTKIKKQHLDKYRSAHDKLFPKTKSHWIRRTE